MSSRKVASFITICSKPTLFFDRRPCPFQIGLVLPE
ncbi:unnamed protein product [Musa acuminata subsp. malaccensis]|uniref:(wild Malaysian banana) hypothetical protein n=1 Tax=Musa acuminata subsp. malaccensis TaxID=214687 RepID=A0A8D7FB05_MUSAM|nr:unnamed protein product [Musa acuminata subsp. malaccensis]